MLSYMQTRCPLPGMTQHSCKSKSLQVDFQTTVKWMNEWIKSTAARNKRTKNGNIHLPKQTLLLSHNKHIIFTDCQRCCTTATGDQDALSEPTDDKLNWTEISSHCAHLTFPQWPALHSLPLATQQTHSHLYTLHLYTMTEKEDTS